MIPAKPKDTYDKYTTVLESFENHKKMFKCDYFFMSTDCVARLIELHQNRREDIIRLNRNPLIFVMQRVPSNTHKVSRMSLSCRKAHVNGKRHTL